jgi:hypothetical protein
MKPDRGRTNPAPVLAEDVDAVPLAAAAINFISKR